MTEADGGGVLDIGLGPPDDGDTREGAAGVEDLA